MEYSDIFDFDEEPIIPKKPRGIDEVLNDMTFCLNCEHYVGDCDDFVVCGCEDKAIEMDKLLNTNRYMTEFIEERSIELIPPYTIDDKCAQFKPL